MLLGLLLGLVVGGIGGGLLGWFVGNDDSSVVSIDGDVPTNPIPGQSFGSDEASPPSVETSREDPAEVGTTVEIGNGWEVTVDGFEPDGTDAVLAGNDYADPPPDGQTFVLVELTTTYLGGEEDSQAPFFGMDLALVGSDGVERTEFDAPCTAPEPTFDNSSELYPGASASGNVCFAVGVDEVDSLVLVVSPSMMFDSTKSFLAVQ